MMGKGLVSVVDVCILRAVIEEGLNRYNLLSIPGLVREYNSRVDPCCRVCFFKSKAVKVALEGLPGVLVYRPDGTIQAIARSRYIGEVD